MSWTADPTSYQRNARFNVNLAGPILELLAPQDGERMLDVGCGDGALTRLIADAGVAVTGVDSSPEMVAATRDRGLAATTADGHDLPAALGPVDAVFSNAALHWMPEPEDVIRGVASVLRPGGRFVAEFGGFGNVAAYRVAARSALDEHGVGAPLPDWYFPRDREYETRLTRHGFDVEHCRLVPRPTPLETGARAWFETFLGSTLDTLAAPLRGDVLDRIQQLLAPVVRDRSGTWWADYVRLRVRAVMV